MSKAFARRSAAVLTSMLLVGCSTDKPVSEPLSSSDLPAPTLSVAQLADPNGVIVTVKATDSDGTIPSDVLSEIERQGAQVSYVDRYSKLLVVQGLKDQSTLQANASVSAILPNREFTVTTDQSSAHFFSTDARQQNLAAIRASNAWVTPFNGSGVKVCIIDSGIDDSHPDLAGRVVKAISFRGAPDENPAADLNGHGTHVASTIVSNGIGIGSVAPDAMLMNARVFGAGGSGTTAQIVSAVRWCGREGAHVINMSLGLVSTVGAYSFDAPLQAAITDVRLGTDPVNSGPGGVVVVAAAGNDNLRFPSAYARYVPAALDGVIAVGATARATNIRAMYSNRGKFVDLWAPGSSILAACSTLSITCDGGTIRQLPSTPGNAGRYMEISGTSMATPHVAGVAAIAYGRMGITRSPAQGLQVENCLLTHARVTGQVQQLPDPSGARVDALLAATAPGCAPSPM